MSVCPQAFFLCLGQIILIAISTQWVAVTIPFCVAVFYVIQKFYLRTSRQLRFLDLEAKSPLYTNFLESLSGLMSIRSFGWSYNYRQRNLKILDNSQAPFYLLYCVQRWLNLVLDLVVAGVAVVLITIAVELRGSISPGLLGVALVNVTQLSENLKLLITDWTKLETSIGAVSRVRSFVAETACEHQPNERHAPPKGWPIQGSLEIRHLSAHYR